MPNKSESSFPWSLVVVGGVIYWALNNVRRDHVARAQENCRLDSEVAGVRDWDTEDGITRPEVVAELSSQMDALIATGASWTKETLAGAVTQEILGCSLQTVKAAGSDWVRFGGRFPVDQLLGLAAQRIDFARALGEN